MLKSLLSGAVRAAFVVALAAGLTGVADSAETTPRWLFAQAEAKPSGVGAINAVDVAKHRLTIAHGPIAALNWPGMTMTFAVAPEIDLSAIKPGAKIAFTLTRGADGAYVIDQIRPAE